MSDLQGLLVANATEVVRAAPQQAFPSPLPGPKDEAWSLRRRALLRAVFPDKAPPPADCTPKDGQSGQLIVLPEATGRATATAPIASAPSQTSRTTAKKVSMELALPLDTETLRRRAEAGKRERRGPTRPKWAIKRVLCGHSGWVRTVAVDPTNTWFASGGSDAVIKVWDLATGRLRLSLTGHIETIRAICHSEASPYMFSVGEDKKVKCWDLETNSVVRDFHGHLSAVYTAQVHPTLDVLLTAGRDATVRVWDIRTRGAVHVLTGHAESVWSLAARAAEPQVVSGSGDGMVKLWDLAAGRCVETLTRHRKPVKAIVAHQHEATMVTAGADNVRKWKLPSGEFFTNLVSSDSATTPGVAACAAVSPHNVLAVGSEDGKLSLYDWSSHSMYYQTRTKGVPGTLPGEESILGVTFDKSGSRLITAEGDKSIKMWKEVESLEQPTQQ